LPQVCMETPVFFCHRYQSVPPCPPPPTIMCRLPPRVTLLFMPAERTRCPLHSSPPRDPTHRPSEPRSLTQLLFFQGLTLTPPFPPAAFRSPAGHFFAFFFFFDILVFCLAMVCQNKSCPPPPRPHDNAVLALFKHNPYQHFLFFLVTPLFSCRAPPMCQNQGGHFYTLPPFIIQADKAFFAALGRALLCEPDVTFRIPQTLFFFVVFEYKPPRSFPPGEILILPGSPPPYARLLRIWFLPLRRPPPTQQTPLPPYVSFRLFPPTQRALC